MANNNLKIKKTNTSDFSVTYKLNKKEGVFNWYPYTEGFSKSFVDRMIEHFNIDKKHLVLDPFGGCGTTTLSCFLKEIPSMSIEVNPFMNFILKSKVESLKINPNRLDSAYKELKLLIKKEDSPEISSFLRDKDFINIDNLKQALKIKNSINKLESQNNIKNFFLLQLSSIIVKISNMIRATDLRYRKEHQGKLDVNKIFFEKVEKALNDLKQIKISKSPEVHFINSDTRNLSENARKFLGKVDFFITSPPYLNGTNYERNTKLEMAFLDFIKEDSDLRRLRDNMITAGINSTKSKDKEGYNLDFLKPLINKVEEKAYDKRIPLMVEGYFNDMNLALKNIHNLMKKKGKGVIVIGDSQFGGVHIETDLILAKLCELNNLKVMSIESVRKRRSKNGMELRESLIFVEK